MAVPKWMQKRVRDNMFDFSKAAVTKLQSQLEGANPNIFTAEFPANVTIDADKKGSNQHQFKGKVLFTMEHEAFEELENGAKFKPFKGVFIQRVKTHERKFNKPKSKSRVKRAARFLLRRRKQRTSVKGHNRQYINMKPVKLNSGEWRILKGTPATKGRKTVYKKVRKLLTEQEVATYIKTYLK